MKKTFTLSVLLLLAVAARCQTYVSGFINANTTWTVANSPYVVNGNALVSQGYTLTIDPGVVIKFDTSCALQVDGELIAVGTAANRITFTSNQPSPQAGDWAELHFSDYCVNAVFDAQGNYLSGTIMKYCDVLYGGSETGFGQIHIESSSPYFSQCRIMHSKSSGIYCNYASCVVDTSVINDCVNYGMYFYQIQLNSCGLAIVNDSISNNQGGGVYIYDSPGCATAIKNNYFYGNAGVGAIDYATSNSSPMDTLNMTQNYFINNKTTGGTSIVTLSGDQYLIANNYFINDTALAASLFSLSSSNSSFLQNYFADNVAESSILDYGASNTSIKQNSFINNSVLNGIGSIAYVVGGGIYDSIECNRFLNNQLNGQFGQGALYAHLDKAIITNNIFDGNTNSNGVSVATVRSTIANGPVVFANNTIRNNSSPLNSYCQFMPYIATTNPLLFIQNNNFTNNTASNVLYILGSNAGSANYNFLKMSNNNFIDPNARYELYNDIPYGSPDLFPDSNYWGSTNTQHVDSVIYDYFDNATLSVVYYLPVLTSPVIIDTICPASFPNAIAEVNGVDVSSTPFPNPFSIHTEITVGKELTDASLLLYNVFGQKVREVDAINGTHISLRRDGLPSGIYIYEITEKEMRIGNGKLVVE